MSRTKDSIKTTSSDNKAEEKAETPKLKQTAKKKIPLSYDIACRSGVQGGLIYVSKKNGYETYWESYGAIEYLTFEELVAMRNGSSAFFKENWIFFEDAEDYTAEEIYYALGVDKYYKSILEMPNIDEVLSLPPVQLEKKIKNASTGIKRAMVSRAKQLLDEGSDIMDSNKKVQLIERVFDVELIPKDIQ